MRLPWDRFLPLQAISGTSLGRKYIDALRSLIWEQFSHFILKFRLDDSPFHP